MLTMQRKTRAVLPGKLRKDFALRSYLRRSFLGGEYGKGHSLEIVAYLEI